MSTPDNTTVEPRCLVQRILVPTNNFEARCIAECRPVWQVTVWVQGMVQTSTMCRATPPDIFAALTSLADQPFAWEPVKSPQP